MIRSKLFLAMILFACLPGTAQEVETPNPFLPSGANAYYTLGNGRLTVAFDDRGQLVTCRWPTPSSANQMATAKTPADTHRPGASWALRVAGETTWPTDDQWQWTVTNDDSTAASFTAEGVHSEYDIRVQQTAFVHPVEDVLVWKLRVDGAESPPALYWHANFSPATQRLAGLATLESLFNAPRDFAVFRNADDDGVFHFRPGRASSAHWTEAEKRIELATANDAWDRLEDGVWIAYGWQGDALGFGAGLEDSDAAAYHQVDSDALNNRYGAVGHVDSAVSLTPSPINGGYEAIVYVALGADRANAAARLQSIRSKTFDALAEETKSYWSRWTSKAALPEAMPPAVSALAQRALLTIATLTDAASGSVSHRIDDGDAWAADWPRYSPWTTYALAKVGMTDEAQKHTLFLSKAVRAHWQEGRPTGSLPMALYGDGQQAWPHHYLDAEAAAWYLWSARHHVETFAPREKRAPYATALWPSIESAADFLVQWADNRSRIPLPSFDPRLGRDATSPSHLPIFFMGIDSAIELANRLGHQRPDWIRRRTELEGMTRRHFLGNSGLLSIDNAAQLWPTDFMANSRRPWRGVPQQAIDAAAEATGIARIKHLCDAASLIPRDKDQGPAQQEAIESFAASEDTAIIAADSYAAALYLIAVTNAY